MRIWGRPIGVVALCALLATNGLSALASAVGLIGGSADSFARTGLTAIGVPVALAMATVGLLLLRRSYLLWTFNHGAWRATVIIASLGATLSLVSLVAAPLSFAAWPNLIASLLTIILLLRPEVRSLFQAPAPP